MLEDRIINSKSSIRRFNQWRNLAIIGACGLILGISASIGQIANAYGANMPFRSQIYTLFAIFACVPSAFIFVIAINNLSKIHKTNAKSAEVSFSN